jgi:hypothetical protein
VFRLPPSSRIAAFGTPHSSSRSRIASASDRRPPIHGNRPPAASTWVTLSARYSRAPRSTRSAASPRFSTGIAPSRDSPPPSTTATSAGAVFLSDTTG